MNVIFNPRYHVFKYKKNKHYQEYKTNPSLTQFKDVLKAVEEDGLYVQPGFLSQESIEKIKKEVERPANEVYKNTYTGTYKTHRFEDYGVYRLLNVDDFSPASKEFYNHPLINEVAKAYVSPKVSSYQKMVELKPEPGKKSIADDFHFDDWRHRFKAFLYLNDVNEENAPFVYVKKSHDSNDNWRIHKEFEYYRDGKKGSYGYYTDTEMDEIFKNKNYEKVVCTAKAGTLILTDTRGLHRGSALLSGQRLVLANFFDVRK